MYDFIRNPALGPQSRIRRTIRSEALKTKNAIDMKNKSKVNEILHEVVDNNNNNSHPHMSKGERKLLNMKKHSSRLSTTVNSTDQHTKNE